jgi:hypothetical protein
VDTGLGLPDRDFLAALADVLDPADEATLLTREVFAILSADVVEFVGLASTYG